MNLKTVLILGPCATLCHALAEHILRMPANTNRTKWLKEKVAAEIVASSPGSNALTGSIAASTLTPMHQRSTSPKHLKLLTRGGGLMARSNRQLTQFAVDKLQGPAFRSHIR